MNVPSFRTWTAGEIVTAAYMNSNIRDAGNYFLARPLAILRQTVGQACTSGANTSMLLDTEDLDRDNGHSTSSNTSRYTSPTPGYFLHMGGAAFPSNATGPRGAQFQKNGAVLNYVQTFIGPTPSGGWSGGAIPQILFLNGSTDYTELYAVQISGGSLTTLVTAGSQANMMILWVSS